MVEALQVKRGAPSVKRRKAVGISMVMFIKAPWLLSQAIRDQQSAISDEKIHICLPIEERVPVSRSCGGSGGKLAIEARIGGVPVGRSGMATGDLRGGSRRSFEVIAGDAGVGCC